MPSTAPKRSAVARRDAGAVVRYVQTRLQLLYGVRAPRVERFVRPSDGGREVLYLREHREQLEIALYLPPEALARGSSIELGDDLFCQVAEGVSHFLYLTDRAKCGRPVTQLELELQAEVDKFVLLLDDSFASKDEQTVGHVRRRLFDNVAFLHPEGSELGDRYRAAHHLASCFARRIEHHIRAMTLTELRRELCRFFGAGQRQKVEMALAA